MAEKILIIDDDMDTLRLVGLMLQRQGYQIVAASNGQQGLDKAFEESPDLILLDVMMPDIDGYEVTRRLRQNLSTAETPILMFTAKAQLDDKVVGFEVGVDDYLTKPTHPTELQARVRTLLARVGEKKDKAEPAGDGNKGYVIGIIGARGGLGVTTVAVNLAAGLRMKTKSQVVLAELVTGPGALGLELGLNAKEGLNTLLSLKKLNEINAKSIDRVLVSHGSGIKVLVSSDPPRDVSLMKNEAHYQAIISRLAGAGRFIVMDMGVGLQPFASKALPLCDEVLIVLEGVPNTIIQARTLIEDVVKLGVNSRSINVVLNNRVRSDTQLPLSTVQTNLDHEIISTLTAAPEIFLQATQTHTPAVLCQPDSLTSRQVGKLVDFIMEREALPR